MSRWPLPFLSRGPLWIATLCLLFTLSAQAADLAPSYSWQPLKIGGGGWVVGMDIHPTEDGLMYIRTDVSGAYRWDAPSSTWKQIVTAASLPPDYVTYGKYSGVDSLVAAPNSPDIAYMAYGGQIFRSTDRGDHWLPTTFGTHQVSMEPNGEGRQSGERLAIDPHNSATVYYASITHGLWTTSDAGQTWTQVSSIPTGSPPQGVNTIIFDLASRRVAPDGQTSQTSTIYVTVDQVGIFQTTDAGATWSDITKDGPPSAGHIRDAEIGPDATYYVVYDNPDGAIGAIWMRPSDGTWKEITPSSDQGGSQSYADIAVDPRDPQRIVALCNGGKAFVSLDQGTTWTTHSFQLHSPEIKWLGTQENYWLSVGEIAFDSHGTLWFAEGFGVWKTSDLTSEHIPWTAVSSGIEETCGNDIISPPGGKPIGAMWDVGVFRFDTHGTYTAQRALPYFMSAWSLDWTPADPRFIAAVFRNHLSFPPHINETGFSTDGGITWTIFPAVAQKQIPPDLDYGIIAISAQSTDRLVWAPVQKLPYFTTDRGATWHPSSFGPDITDTGFLHHFSPQKPLCADRVLPDTFYFYHTRRGLFRSTDAGATFSPTSTSPPLGRVNSILKAVPSRPGHLLFAEGHQGNPVGGLWHSTDSGDTWSQLPFIQQAFNVGLGKPLDDQSYPTIFVAGVADGATGIYRSTDQGTTWVKIATYPLGIFDWIDALDGDKDTFGTLYLAFAQAGFAIGTPTPDPAKK